MRRRATIQFDNPGQMRERVTIQKRAQTVDTFGEVSTQWAAHATVWAEVKPVRAREGDDQMQVATAETFLITIRYRADVKPLDRITWRERTLNIRTAENRDMRQQWLSMECATSDSNV